MLPGNFEAPLWRDLQRNILAGRALRFQQPLLVVDAHEFVRGLQGSFDDPSAWRPQPLLPAWSMNPPSGAIANPPACTDRPAGSLAKAKTHAAWAQPEVNSQQQQNGQDEFDFAERVSREHGDDKCNEAKRVVPGSIDESYLNSLGIENLSTPKKPTRLADPQSRGAHWKF